MKSYIFLLAVATAALSSCTTAYKTGQTPDDVYYSPVRPQDEYVRAEKRDVQYYEGREDYYTDRYIRMRIQNRYQWSVLDDYYFNNAYAYSPYAYYNNWSSPWNSYWAWNSYCNPYFSSPYYGGPIIIKNPVKYQPPSRAIVFNPNSYINTAPTVSSPNNNGRKGLGGYFSSGSNGGSYNGGSTNGSYNGGGSRYNNSNSSSRSSDYSNSSQSNSPSSSTPSRSYSPSSSSSSSSSSSGSSSGSSSSGSSSRPPR